MALDRVLLIFDGGTTSQAILREGFQSDPSVGLSNVHVEAVSVDTFGQWQKTVVNAKASGYDAMLVGLYHNFIDDQGVHISEDEVIKWTSVHSPVPAFSLWDYAVGKEKMIGGYVISGTRQGRLAAKMANRLLKLAKPSIMPDVTYSAEFIFSHTQLKKWGIALPEKISRVAEFVD